MVKLNEDNYVVDFDDYAHIFIPKNCVGITSKAYESLCVLADDRETITVEEGNPIYKSSGNCLIDITRNTLVLGCHNSFIPDDGSIKTIGAYAFSGIGGMESEKADSFTYIHIPQSVKNIQHHAFADTGLTHLEFPNDLEEIGSMAFMLTPLGKDGKRVDIPKTVTKIGTAVFSGCRYLSRIHFSENDFYKSECDCIIEKSTKTLISVHCGKFAEILPDTVEKIQLFAFLGQNTNTRYYIDDNYKEIAVSPKGLPKNIEFPIIIVAHKNSYAHKFALEHGIAYEEWK